MSVHGDQKILPMYILRLDSVKPATINEEISLAFYFLTKNLKESEKIKTFSRMLLPTIFIQGAISTHIVLEGLMLTGFEKTITNPPRQALAGHILRNVDNRAEVDMLERIIDIITYKDKDAKEVSTSEEDAEEAEFQQIKLPALLNPSLLNGIKRILPYLTSSPINEYAVLDTLLTTEQALNFAEKYRNIMDLLKGNSLRWQNMIKLIQDEIDKWLIELNVKFKDMEIRYNSEIGKIDKVIDTSIVDERIKDEKDKIDVWVQNQKKSVIETILQQFITVDRKLIDLVKKNKFYTHIETFKANRLEDVSTKVQDHLKFLQESTQGFLEFIESISIQLEEHTNKGIGIDERATSRLKEVEKNLKSELEQKDQKISEFKVEKDSELGQIEEFKKNIEGKFRVIKETVSKKSSDCLREIETLKEWNIEDKESEHLSMPVIWIYLPLYLLLVEDEEEFEERIILSFPGFINKGSSSNESLKEELDPAFNEFLDILNKNIEDDMKIRSNFEFVGDSKNLLDDSRISNKIEKGISALKTRGILDGLMALEMEKCTRLLPQSE